VATGWGVIDASGRELSHVASGVIRPHGVRAAKLGVISREVHGLCEEFSPAVLVLEESFVGRNLQTALRLGEARGAVMSAAAGAAVPVVEYSPAQIKMAVCGNGRGHKEQVQAMVMRLLRLRRAVAADEGDALAAAICHLHTNRVAARLETQGGQRRGRARPAVRAAGAMPSR